MERINKTKSIVSTLVLSCLFFSSCQKHGEKDSISFQVNQRDKSFHSLWEHRPALSGREEVLRLMVSGNKFRLNAPSSSQRLRSDFRTIIIYDGKTVYEIDQVNKEIRKHPMSKWRILPFWNMPPAVTPFGKPQKTGEDTIAGREADIYEIRGKRQSTEIFLTYWVDKEKKVLLKKQHVIGPKHDPLFSEVYECMEIRFGPAFEADTFICKPISGYLEIQLGLVDIDLLNTKF